MDVKCNLKRDENENERISKCRVQAELAGRMPEMGVRGCQCEGRNGGIIRKVAEDEEDGERI